MDTAVSEIRCGGFNQATSILHGKIGKASTMVNSWRIWRLAFLLAELGRPEIKASTTSRERDTEDGCTRVDRRRARAWH
jgi:hypothetical protein